MRKLMTRLIPVAAAAAFVTASAPAAYSTINDSGETTVAEILDVLYGDGSIDGDNNAFEGWSSLEGSFTHNGVTLTRVHDRKDNGDRGDSLNIAGTQTLDQSVTDQVWVDGIADAAGEARFAGFNQQFGFKNGDSGGSYTNLFNLSGSGFGVSGGFSGQSFAGEWRWGRDGGGDQQSSRDDENDGGTDQMVTFKVEGLTGGKYDGALAVWVVFFEDKDGNDGGADFDYNDLVVEIIAVPLPAPLALAGLGLIGVAAGRKRLRRLVS
jgi:hypothetical protein